MGQQLSVYIPQTSQTAHSWLVNVDGAGRPQTKLPLHARLLFIWFWARKMSQVQTKDCLNGIIGQRNQETLSDWSSYVHEILVQCLNDAQPIGGPAWYCSKVGRSMHAWKTKESRWTFNAW